MRGTSALNSLLHVVALESGPVKLGTTAVAAEFG